MPRSSPHSPVLAPAFPYFLPVSPRIPASFCLSSATSSPSPSPRHPSRFSHLPVPPSYRPLPPSLPFPSSLPLRLSARRNQNFQALPLTNPGDFFFVVWAFFVPSSGRKVGRRSPCAPPAGWEGERRCVPAGKGKGMRAPRPFFHPFYPQKAGSPRLLVGCLTPRCHGSEGAKLVGRGRGKEGAGCGTAEPILAPARRPEKMRFIPTIQDRKLQELLCLPPLRLPAPLPQCHFPSSGLGLPPACPTPFLW